MSEHCDASARVLELRGEREALEARLAAITSEVDGLVEGMLLEGVTGLEVARLCGWSKQRVSQLKARVAARADAQWAEQGAYQVGRGELRRAALDAFAFARDAQEARAERYSLGYAEERRAFFGDPSVAACEGEAETVHRFAGMYESLEAERDRVSV